MIGAALGLVLVQAPGNLLGYFNEHGFAPEYADYVRSLFSLLGDSLHSYIHMGNRQMPPEASACLPVHFPRFLSSPHMQTRIMKLLVHDPPYNSFQLPSCCVSWLLSLSPWYVLPWVPVGEPYRLENRLKFMGECFLCLKLQASAHVAHIFGALSPSPSLRHLQVSAGH